MKRAYLILFILVSISFASYSQFNQYHPFPTANARWGESTWWEEHCGNTNAGGSKDFDYSLAGDTTINGLLYHKLNVSGENEWSACSQHKTLVTRNYDTTLGYIREDSRKIYFTCLKKGIHDTLLYDFSLKVGDTLPNTYICKKVQKNIVLRIDSIFIGNSYRKEYIIGQDASALQVTLVEGIGSLNGLLEPLAVNFEAGSRLNCFRQNNITLFPHLNDSGLFIYNAASKQILNVYPYPSETDVTVSYQLPKGEDKGILRLYKANGMPLNVRFVNSDKLSVIEDLGALNAGIYYYTLSDEHRILAKHEFIIPRQK
ncbi:MAG TPA: hypothetical protein VNZ45_04840 [Bacteroidia bacterium]|jgi:hypothetical protein|nr:hypothetical protein [Bacteroidia bacterium]